MSGGQPRSGMWFGPVGEFVGVNADGAPITASIDNGVGPMLFLGAEITFESDKEWS